MNDLDRALNAANPNNVDKREPVTVTIKVNGYDITVELIEDFNRGWLVFHSVDEDGNFFPLDEDETDKAIALAQAGVDETGR